MMQRVGLFLLVILSTVAGGETSTSPNGTVEESIFSPTKRFGIDLYSWTYTNPFGEWNGRTATTDGATGEPFQIINQLTLHTPAFGGFDLEVTPQIVLQPYQGERVRLLEPSVGLEGNFIETSGFTYWARLEVLLPLSGPGKDDGLVAGPQAVQSIEWLVPGSRWRLEVSFTPQVRFYNNGETAMNVYVSPRVFYSFTDAFSVLSIVETSVESPRGLGLVDWKAGALSVGAGCRYQSGGGEGLWVMPFLNMYPAGPIASNTHLGVFFGGPVL
jgi:hypothetical protein